MKVYIYIYIYIERERRRRSTLWREVVSCVILRNALPVALNYEVTLMKPTAGYR